MIQPLIQQLSAIHPLLPPVVGLLVLLLVAVVADLVAKRTLLATVRAAARRTQHKWDDALLDHKVFGRLALIVPAIVIFLGIGLVPGIAESARDAVRNVASAYMVLMSCWQ